MKAQALASHKYYLYIYGANCYNENQIRKTSFERRYK